MPKTTKTNNRPKKTVPSGSQDLDSVFLLKLVLFLILGSQWVRFTDDSGVTVLPLPVGFVVGLLFATHDHFQIDRRIEFAVLLVAMFVGFWTQVGVYIRL